jgi:hypothetical protein
VDATFSADLFEWRGPAPFYWLALPPDVCDTVAIAMNVAPRNGRPAHGSAT